MAKIDELLQELCPDGVEWKTLGEVSNLSRGKVYSKSYITNNAGSYPVYSSQTKNEGVLGNISTFDYDGEFLTWTTDGAYAGSVFHRNCKFSITNVCGLIKLTSDSISYRFLYYWLSIHAKEYVYEGMGNPKLMTNQMISVTIPLPPLPIQQHIVEVLDTFTDAISNLEEELALREKQFGFYRESILSFENESVDWTPISELGQIIRGNGLQKKDFVQEGVGCIHYGQIYTKFGLSTSYTLSFVDAKLADKLTKVDPGNLVIACTSENVDDLCKSVVWLGNTTIVTGGHACVLKHKENAKYIGYCFTSNSFQSQKKKFAYGTKVLDIKKDKLGEIKIPVPSLERQQEIVEILDTFEATIANIKEEISLRTKQYEYYREKLLSFGN